MYARRSLRNQQPKPSIPHASAMTASVPGLSSALWGGPISHGGQQLPPAEQAPYEITSASTMPEPHSGGTVEVERSRSGNLLFRRNRSVENKKEQSRARAEELSQRLELSEDRDLELNKSGNFARSHEVRGTPGLGANMMNSAQAAAMVADANKQKNQQAQNNILLTEHERNQSKAEMMKIQASSNPDWGASPIEVVQGANSDQFNDMALNKTLTFETVSSTSSAGVGVDIVLNSSNEPALQEPQDNSFSKQKFYAYPEAHPQKKMTRTEKKIELARQARINKQRKRDIPDLC